MGALPEPKLAKAKKLADAGDWIGAMRIIQAFPQLGEQDEIIRKGWNARLRPNFYRELGFDTDELWANSVRAVCERYNWTIPEWAK